MPQPGQPAVPPTHFDPEFEPPVIGIRVNTAHDKGVVRSRRRPGFNRKNSLITARPGEFDQAAIIPAVREADQGDLPAQDSLQIRFRLTELASGVRLVQYE